MEVIRTEGLPRGLHGGEGGALTEDSLESLKRQREWGEAWLGDLSGRSVRAAWEQC